MDFYELVAVRWREAGKVVGFDPSKVDLIWGVGDNYPHFKDKRGYGVTFYETGIPCKLLFSSKVLRAPFHRVDGVVRHEIGHVVDMVFPEAQVDAWAETIGYSLPHTPERRADAIAEAIWKEPIRYDEDLVQSTKHGVYPRPRHLGL